MEFDDSNTNFINTKDSFITFTSADNNKNNIKYRLI